MAGKYLDLDLDKNLGGNKPSDTTVPSQAAIKSYVDNLMSSIVHRVNREHIDKILGFK